MMRSSKHLSDSPMYGSLQLIWGHVHLYTKSPFFWGAGSFTLKYWLSLAELKIIFGLTTSSDELMTILFLFDISCSLFYLAYLKLINISLLLFPSVKFGSILFVLCKL